jgi:hypothetical protein
MPSSVSPRLQTAAALLDPVGEKLRDDPRWAAIALALFALLALFAFWLMRTQALFQDQDFAFYASSYLSIFSDRAQPVVNAWGTNMFGIFGFDGYPTLHGDIHFSPVKYLLALLGHATGTPVVIQVLFVALLVASLALAGRQLERIRPGAGHAFVLLAVAYPVAIPFVTFDLRIFILLLPAMLFLYVAIDRSPSP